MAASATAALLHARVMFRLRMRLTFMPALGNTDLTFLPALGNTDLPSVTHSPPLNLLRQVTPAAPLRCPWVSSGLVETTRADPRAQPDPAWHQTGLEGLDDPQDPAGISGRALNKRK
jgi:hypothetical protein